jgi:ABC-type molybdate transport system permease subunit
MDRYEGRLNALTVALHRGIYLAIIMDRYEGPLNALTVALHRGLYLAIIMDRYEGPLTALINSLACRPLVTHYNGPI